MGRIMRTLGSLAVTAAVGGVLASCALIPQPVVTRLPTPLAQTPSPSAPATPSPTASASPSTATPAAPVPVPSAPTEGLDCGGAAVTIDAGSASTVLRGDCPVVRVQGAALTADLTRASVGELTVAGDRVSVGLGAATSVAIEGNDISIVATSIGALTLAGDRNTISATSTIGSVQISGNDNTVRGSGLGVVTNGGDRNTIG